MVAIGAPAEVQLQAEQCTIGLHGPKGRDVTQPPSLPKDTLMQTIIYQACRRWTLVGRTPEKATCRCVAVLNVPATEWLVANA